MNAQMEPKKQSVTTEAVDPIRLNFQDGGRPVVVCPEDNDRFVLTSSTAAEACKQAYNRTQWDGQFRKMLYDIRQWAESSSTSVKSCFISIREGQLVVFVSPSKNSYDLVLADELTELDIQIASKFPLCRVEVLQVPGRDLRSLSAYFNPSEALEVYGDYSRTSGKVEA